MAQSFSFDIVSEYDVAEIANVVDQTAKEIQQRYDFKGTPASVELVDDKSAILIKGEDYQLEVVLDIIRGKCAKRGVDQNTLDISATKEEGNPWRWKLGLQKGINQEKAKKLTKLIRDTHPKIKTQIQGDAIRVVGSNKDDLQAVMKLVRSQDLDFPISFTNYR
jgi:uncharacterized protein YajQ (UPF0234 family)